MEMFFSESRTMKSIQIGSYINEKTQTKQTTSKIFAEHSSHSLTHKLISCLV